MVGGRLRCLSCFIACSSVLLLGVCLYDVEASNCQHVIHKKVGDTAELPSCSATEEVTSATWRYGKIIIADKDDFVAENNQFKGRLNLNPTNFSLTIRELALKDSGNFSFVSEVNYAQQPTVAITLQVHEPITEKPVLTGNSTWHNLNQSCTVLLECSAPTDGRVSYNWTVGNQTRSGSRLQYVIKMHDGDTKFICTVYNFVSEMSASKTMKCSNDTQEDPGSHLIYLVAGGAGAAFILIVLVIAVVCCYCKHNQAGSDVNDLTVYADITEVASVDDPESVTKPCSVYETIDNRVTTITPGPQTVYDKIQLSRVRKASVSPYQEIS